MRRISAHYKSAFTRIELFIAIAIIGIFTTVVPTRAQVPSNYTNANVDLETFGQYEPEAFTIITNPGEDASTQMRIGWHTNEDVLGSYLTYTKRSDTTWASAKTVPGEFELATAWNGITGIIRQNGVNNTVTQTANYHDYGVELSGLEPDTEYMYRVGKNVLSDVHYFRTAGADEFSFAWISDFHAYNPLPRRLTAAMSMVDRLVTIDPGIGFVLSTGDKIAHGGTYLDWEQTFASTPFQKYMWVNVNGNHDNMDRTNSRNSRHYFRHAHNKPLNGYGNQMGVVYWFKYANTLWFVLNTEEPSVEAEKAWMADVIAKNPTQYIFVVQHYQWFNGITGAASSSGFTRWGSFFDQMGVDMAFAGNDHIYVRTLPIYNGEVSIDPTKGTVYIQAPSSCNERGREMNQDLSRNANLIAARWTEGAATTGGIIVTVNKEGISVALYDRSGTQRDNAYIPARRPALERDIPCTLRYNGNNLGVCAESLAL